MIFGMGNGLLSIVTGTLPLALFGSDGYGKLQGKMMAARLILSALAPFALALSMENFGLAPSIGGRAARSRSSSVLRRYQVVDTPCKHEHPNILGACELHRLADRWLSEHSSVLSTSPRGVIIVARCLLNRSMTRLLHRLG